MLRISVLDAPHTTRFKLEGKLAHEWVAEMEKTWSAAVSVNSKKKVIVDLADVSFVDDRGKELLTLIHRAGTELTGSGPMVTALIKEIHQKLAESRSTVRKEAVSLLLIVMFLFVVACAGQSKSMAIRHDRKCSYIQSIDNA